MSTHLSTTNSQLLSALDGAAGMAQIFLPQFTAFIVMGRAAAKAAPGLYEDVVKLLSKAEPTAEEKADLARKLEALAHPEKEFIAERL